MLGLQECTAVPSLLFLLYWENKLIEVTKFGHLGTFGHWLRLV